MNPEHACPFCMAPLNLTPVPPGANFRCGGCNEALEAGESRLGRDEVLAYRKRQRMRRVVLCMLAADLAAAAAYFAPFWPQDSRAWVRWAATAVAAMVVGLVLAVVTGRRRAPVPVAPPLDKVQG